MEYAIIVFLVVALIVILIVSDSKKLTCSSSIGYVIRTVYQWIKAIIPKNEVYYPTGIGYDTNGCFCPGAVEKEFEDLGQLLDGLYLSNHVYNNDLFKYSFKYARMKNDMNGLELYDYMSTHPHMLLTGSSGSGKSYALTYLLGMLVKEGSISITFCDFKNCAF